MRLDQSSVDLSTLAEKIERGEIDLQPDFQRGQVWSDSKKKRLIDTVLRQWYIPAIHIVVNDELDKEEVLDGQQRVRSIIEFMDDKFAVDGHIEPRDAFIAELDGLYYSELPDAVRSKFKRFAITTVRLRDYRPEEPGELFFRLNQLTALTAAEQRNALIGEPRNQIRILAGLLESKGGSWRIGFSNARMNYDDVLSRLAIVLESGRLQEKITAAKLEKRYRSGRPFPYQTVSAVQHAINQLASVLDGYSGRVHLNKASLFSWLFFISDIACPERDVNILADFFQTFESARNTKEIDLFSDESNAVEYPLSSSPALSECLVIFNDRASSRVNDVSSVVLRDMCLNVALFVVGKRWISELKALRKREPFLTSAAKRLAQLPKGVADRTFAETDLAGQWERYREADQA